ncbi:DUF305 domain-containing protein [Mycolicibacterium sp. 050158]|uniref:DUF305 domain-containing protein n=1 Tax=Mycolicibacterium sp. 050158 TaxID=3090602 RepID=UPI00299EFAF4|nr:DUF305 domain-containing protein [Mycolicibacterium sp. 050158]MDX1892027.1 DUF305 domain-containing protein [Mycolicibacterium sp. 050158]
MFSSAIAMKTTLLTAAIAAAITVSGCSGDAPNAANASTSPTVSTSPAMSEPMPGMDHGGPSTSTATRNDFDDADVMFLQMMYPHHAQAVDMAKLVPSRSQDQKVVSLAEAIEKAQAPEMTQMAGLLESFGKPAPSVDTSTHEMPGTGGMPGMMSAEQMTTLAGLSGAAFDRMWLQMMIDHHAGAIDMSTTELRDGTNPDAKKLAQSIIADQQAEIVEMRSMLG